MKKMTIIVLIMVTGFCHAMSAAELKEAALKACNTQLESVPKDMRKQSKKICECNVEKTDYEAVLAAQKSGNTEQIQADAIKNAQACAEEMM
ncbi:hypothetical protein ACFODZ_01455 [Marinicella sediminis]|uniref:Uncharacterized protein n=1 Tax=Marinicella sediminis TaxID=1792834 RepID=A0ABV7J885_9GAMM|nr:hypothetical protein [Marinicella sediminis]